jgi:hypothetical protein
MLPASPAASSTTKSLHVPFGSVPLKTEAKVATPAVAAFWNGPAGAGAGKTSPVV